MSDYADLLKKSRKTEEFNVMQDQLTHFADEQQVRSVFDIDNQKQVNRQADGLEQTQKDAKLISFALSTDSKFLLSDEQKARLEARQGRNLSHILINSKRFFGDSPEMKAVKTNVQKIEDDLRAEQKKRVTDKTLDNIIGGYNAAIIACEKYLDVKTNKNERYRMVRDTLYRLMGEMECFETMKLKLKDNPELGDVDSCYALLVTEKFTRLTKAEQKKDNDAASDQTAKEARTEHLEKAKRCRVEMEDDTSKLEGSAKQIAMMFSLQNLPSQFAKKKGDDGANLTTYLYYMLKDFPKGECVKTFHPAVSGLKGDEMVRREKRSVKKKNKTVDEMHIPTDIVQIIQDKYGNLSLKVNESKYELPYRRDEIIQQLETNMIDNEDVFGEEITNQAMSWLKSADMVKDSIPKIRSAALKVISKRTGMKPTLFNNTSTNQLRSIAGYLMDGVMDAAEVKDYMEQVSGNTVVVGVFERDSEEDTTARYWQYDEKSANSINGDETLEILEKRRQLLENAEQNKEKLSDKVELAPKEQKKKEEKDKENDPNAWTDEQEEIRNFIADLFYSKDTWTMDGTIGNPVDRYKKLFLEHVHVLAKVVRDPSIVEEMLKKLPIPDGRTEEDIAKGKKAPNEAIMDSLTDIIDEINDGMEKLNKIGNTIKKFNPFSWFVSDEEEEKEKTEEEKLKDVEDFLSATFSTPIGTKKLENLDSSIERATENATDQIKDAISECVDVLFEKKEEVKKVKKPVIGSPDESGITPEEKERRIKLGNDRLKDMLDECMKGDSGQGKFIKVVLKNYFTNVEIIDQRSMLAMALRDAKPMTIAITKESNEADKRKVAGNYLSGIFKGAGPLLQKMLQGLPIDGIPDELKQAFDDVKSNLLPIPDEIVEAQLLSMVESSNGKVTKIKVTRALGAASVGQAFLVKLYGPELDPEGEEKVIKLLRPDVRNRMMREQGVLLSCAAMTNEGMEKTYKGQLGRIAEELDLNIEARNVELGRIYDKSTQKGTAFDGVRSMKLNRLIAPTTTSMVLEKAPGTTVDKYIKELEDREKNILKPYLVYKEIEEDGVKKTVPDLDENGVQKLNTDKVSFDEAQKSRAMLADEIAALQKRQKHLITLASKWVDEGLFGEGFYHGDLHAGNIMIDEDVATVIDFGNATKLDETQKDQITRMMVGAACGDMKLFRSGFHALLGKDEKTEAHYQKQRDAFGRMIKEVFSLGNAKSSGQRIGVVLMKAQELGLELPSAIFNFSQCQLRLQNTIDTVNKHIKDMQKQMDELDKVPAGNPPDFHLDEKFMRTGLMSGLGEAEMKDLRSERKLTLAPSTENDFIKALEDTSEEGIAEFNTICTDELLEKGEQKLKTLADGMNVLKETLTLPNGLEVIKGQGEMLYKEMFSGVKKNLSEEQLKGLKDGLKEALNSYADDPTKLDEFIRNEVPSYTENLTQLRKLQKEGGSPEEIKALEKRTYKAFILERQMIMSETGKEESWGDESEYANHIERMINYFDKADYIKQFEPLYEDEKYGQKLKTEFEEYRNKVRKMGTQPEDQDKKREMFKPVLEIIKKISALKIAKITDENLPLGLRSSKNEEPEDFLDVMGELIAGKVKTLADRCGWWWSFMNRKKAQEITG